MNQVDSAILSGAQSGESSVKGDGPSSSINPSNPLSPVSSGAFGAVVPESESLAQVELDDLIRFFDAEVPLNEKPHFRVIASTVLTNSTQRDLKPLINPVFLLNPRIQTSNSVPMNVTLGVNGVRGAPTVQAYNALALNSLCRNTVHRDDRMSASPQPVYVALPNNITSIAQAIETTARSTRPFTTMNQPSIQFPQSYAPFINNYSFEQPIRKSTAGIAAVFEKPISVRNDFAQWGRIGIWTYPAFVRCMKGNVVPNPANFVGIFESNANAAGAIQDVTWHPDGDEDIHFIFTTFDFGPHLDRATPVPNVPHHYLRRDHINYTMFRFNIMLGWTNTIFVMLNNEADFAYWSFNADFSTANLGQDCPQWAAAVYHIIPILPTQYLHHFCVTNEAEEGIFWAVASGTPVESTVRYPQRNPDVQAQTNEFFTTWHYPEIDHWSQLISFLVADHSPLMAVSPNTMPSQAAYIEDYCEWNYKLTWLKMLMIQTFRVRVLDNNLWANDIRYNFSTYSINYAQAEGDRTLLFNPWIPYELIPYFFEDSDKLSRYITENTIEANSHETLIFVDGLVQPQSYFETDSESDMKERLSKYLPSGCNPRNYIDVLTPNNTIDNAGGAKALYTVTSLPITTALPLVVTIQNTVYVLAPYAIYHDQNYDLPVNHIVSVPNEMIGKLYIIRCPTNVRQVTTSMIKPTYSFVGFKRS